MKRILTKIKKLTTIPLVGKTDASSAEEQLARDNQLNATNCRWGGSNTSAIPFYEQEQFRAFSCLKKPDKNGPAEGGFLLAKGKKSLLTTKWICPIHAEPVQ